MFSTCVTETATNFHLQFTDTWSKHSKLGLHSKLSVDILKPVLNLICNQKFKYIFQELFFSFVVVVVGNTQHKIHVNAFFVFALEIIHAATPGKSVTPPLTTCIIDPIAHTN